MSELLVFEQLAPDVAALTLRVGAVGVFGVCWFLVAWWRRLSEECFVFPTAFYHISLTGSKTLPLPL